MTDQDIHAMKEIFGNLFYMTNKLQTMVDKEFEPYGFTAKQWFLMVVITRFFDTPPKLSDLTEYMGSSYQNIKQLAVKLENNGFVEIQKDPNDKRVLRIALTEKCAAFWANHQNEDLKFMSTLFESYSSEELQNFYHFIEMLSVSVKKMEEKI